MATARQDKSRCGCSLSSTGCSTRHGKTTGRWRVGRWLQKRPWLVWVFPVLGLASLVWFLIRVIPKPSRATYPCQRLAAPLASGFVVWLTSILGSTVVYRKARRLWSRRRYVLAVTCGAVAVGIIWAAAGVNHSEQSRAAFVPSDPPNSPIGQGKGIFPGRVVWVHEPEATHWDGTNGSWWDDENTDQKVVDFMTSKALQTLTGQTSDAAAWDALFHHFNRTHGHGDVGYQPGERVTIKINMNQDSGGTWGRGAGMPSPQVVYSMVKQLVHAAGVPGSAITIYDASRYIGDPIYNKIRQDDDPNFAAIRFVVRPDKARSGRSGAGGDPAHPIHFAHSNIADNGQVRVPRCVTQAKYLINLALLRPHTMFGVTLCAKNHFGSVYFPTAGGWTPAPLHNYGRRDNAMGTYNCLVDLIGHPQLGGKTLLYMIDGLYPAGHQSADVIRFVSFGDDWASSLFVSQDPVAIDSVALDFLRSEPRCDEVRGNPDNYLHEAAAADNPPSGTFYDPDGDGVRLGSLGVHEHWNNLVQKQYSRNLGIGEGIELVTPSLRSEDGPVVNVTQQLRYDFIRHAIREAEDGDQIVLEPGVYEERIDLQGKAVVIRSEDPNDPAVVAATVIRGAGRIVSFSAGEDANCVLAGITIRDGTTGVYCWGASPRIVRCVITGHTADGIELENGSKPAFVGCRILGNTGNGILMRPRQVGRRTVYNYPVIEGCVIADNGEDGISGGIPVVTNCTICRNGRRGISSVKVTVTNSIVWGNGEATGQIVGELGAVRYCDVEGGWPGEGNIAVDPCLVDVEAGDYHLKSQAGRWDWGTKQWVCDSATSLCIDAGDPESVWEDELWPHGGRINLGAYGGSNEASMSPSAVGHKADLDHDGMVNWCDFAPLSRYWKRQDELMAEDLNRDGRVDGLDIEALAQGWLWSQ